MAADDINITGQDIAEMMTRVQPYLDRMLRSFALEERAVALMATAAWGVFNLGADHGHKAAQDFALTMAERAHEIDEILAAEEKEDGTKSYDA